METSKIERLRDMKKNEEKQQETAKEKMSREQERIRKKLKQNPIVECN